MENWKDVVGIKMIIYRGGGERWRGKKQKKQTFSGFECLKFYIAKKVKKETSINTEFKAN